jgi:hypothetical protein
MESKNTFFETKEGKATIKFAAWMIFIVILIIVFAINGNNEQKNDTKENNNVKEEISSFKNYEEMVSDLLKSCYNYNFKVTSLENIVIYNGTISNNEDIGYKETSEEIIKYVIIDGITSRIVLDKTTEITNLYDEEDKAFLNIENLFNNLKNYLYSVNKNETKREINYNKDGYQVLVKTNLENITEILITNATKTYELQFTNVSICDNITNK